MGFKLFLRVASSSGGLQRRVTTARRIGQLAALPHAAGKIRKAAGERLVKFVPVRLNARAKRGEVIQPLQAIGDLASDIRLADHIDVPLTEADGLDQAGGPL